MASKNLKAMRSALYLGARAARFGALALASAALVAAAPQGESQDASQPAPVLKAPVGYTVLVDAVVTDKRNRVVDDLKPEDFRIYENDVLQSVDSFLLVRPDNEAEPATRLAPPADATTGVGPPPLRPRSNLIVFLLDYATTQFENQGLVEQACRKYIEENLRTGDQVAIFSLSNSFQFLQDFTSDKQLLLAALSRGDARGNALASNNPAPTIRPGAASVDPISVAGGSPGEVAASAQGAQAQGSAQAELMLAERIQQLYYVMSSFLNRREAYSVLAAIQAISEGVRTIEGRKNLMLFSQGFVVGPNVERELEKTVSYANKANVAIYGVDSMGLATRELSGDLVQRGQLASISSATGKNRVLAAGGESLFDRAKQVGSDVRDSSLRFISSATGGFAIRNTNDLYSSMERIDQDLRTYYLLSYRSTDTDFDGTFRDIRVEVERKNVEVRARSGYLALPPGMEMVSGDEYRLLRGIEEGRTATDLPTFFRIDKLYDPNGELSLLMTLEIPSEAVEFRESEAEDGKAYEADLSVIGLIRDDGGKIVTRIGAPLNLRVPESDIARVRNSSLSFSNGIQLQPGSYSFDVVVQDRNSNRAGRSEVAMRLASDPPESLRVGSIVLGSDVEGGATAGRALTFEGARVVPSASRRFKTGDKLVYYFNVCGFGRDPRTGRAEVEVEVSVKRSGASESIQLPSYLLAEKGGASPQVSTAKFIDLKGLAAGTYFLNATIRDRIGGGTVTGRTLFQVME